MIKEILHQGEKAGFAAVEICWEKSRKTIFESLSSYFADHGVETNNAAIRVFSKKGNPAGIKVSNPNLTCIKNIFSNLYAQNISGELENFSKKLPGAAKKTKVDIFDNTINGINNDSFKEIIDNIYENLDLRTGLKIKKVSLIKEEIKKYQANSRGLNIKYRKTLFTLLIRFIFKDNMMDIGETKTRISAIDPVKLLSRTLGLMNSITVTPNPFSKNCMFILSPEAATLILRELSPHFKLSLKDKTGLLKPDFPSILNIIDNPLLNKQAGSVPFDDEGVQSGEKYLVKKGLFKQYLSNLQEAFSHNLTSTGNGFRSQKSVFPQINFSNLYIKPTVLSLKNLMKDADKGVIITLLKLKHREGNNYFFSANGYWFSNREIKEPVHFYIKTSFHTFFLNILKISKEIKFFYNGQNFGSPYLLLEGKYRSRNYFEI